MAYNETLLKGPMFTNPLEKTKLQVSIDRAHSELQHLDPASDEYGVILDRVTKLHKMLDAERPARVSPDTLVSATASIVGIILILHYERLEIVTTKALGFVPKPR